MDGSEAAEEILALAVPCCSSQASLATVSRLWGRLSVAFPKADSLRSWTLGTFWDQLNGKQSELFLAEVSKTEVDGDGESLCCTTL